MIVDGDLPFALTDGVTITGRNAAGGDVQGKVLGDYEPGPQSTKLRIQYDVDAEAAGCRVGASLSPVTDGCKYHSTFVVYGMSRTNAKGVSDVYLLCTIRYKH